MKQEKLNLTKVDWLQALPCYIDSHHLTGKWAPCPICGDETQVFKLYHDALNGRWHCARCDLTGTGVELIHLVTDKPYREIYHELETKNYNAGGAVATQRPKPERIKVKKEKSPEQKRRELQEAWDGALQITEDTPVWKYLASRIPGLKLEWISPDIRYHPGMDYWDVDGKNRGKFPVMLKRACSADGKPRMLHRTYLTVEGKKVPFLDKKGKSRSKLEMSAPDSTKARGSSIRLNTARSRTLALVEGAETGFAVVAKHQNRVEVRSLLNAGNLSAANINWDDYDHVVIYADRDKVDQKRGFRPGEHYAEVLAEKIRALGKRCSIVASVVEGVDFCDIWAKQFERIVVAATARALRLAQRSEARKQQQVVRQAA
ncbi:hypothetical protein [Paraburkholderia sp. SIMBA_054]|uniref:DUF7146 domain-containing protein n=1 Tax=Paraburkholderia sp. SIMBA_054 TaxID=3085795 RepID=UPI00397D9BF4